MTAKAKGKTPPAKPGKPGTKAKPKTRKVRKLATKPEPAEAGPDDPPAVQPKPKVKRTPVRTKTAGWEKGVVRSACFYVQGTHHQAVNVAASALRVSKGVIVERALVEYLAAHPELDALKPALAAILADDWPADPEA